MVREESVSDKQLQCFMVHNRQQSHPLALLLFQPCCAPKGGLSSSQEPTCWASSVTSTPLSWGDAPEKENTLFALFLEASHMWLFHSTCIPLWKRRWKGWGLLRSNYTWMPEWKEKWNLDWNWNPVLLVDFVTASGITEGQNRRFGFNQGPLSNFSLFTGITSICAHIASVCLAFALISWR